MNKENLLLVPQKTDEERDKVLDAWEAAGGTYRRIDRFWEKPESLEHKKITLYGNDTFALVLAQVIGLSLVSPDDAVIAQLDVRWTRRKIVLYALEDIQSVLFPVFIKPVVPKQFKAAVYHNPAELQRETAGLGGSEKVMVADIVAVEAEARSFILDRSIQDMALYEGTASLEAARLFLEQFLQQAAGYLPLTFVIDLGYNRDSGWFILEFNASWGAGLNNCAAHKVLGCIQMATLPAMNNRLS